MRKLLVVLSAIAMLSISFAASASAARPNPITEYGRYHPLPQPTTYHVSRGPLNVS